MEVKIKRIRTEDANGDGSDVTSTYAVLDNGRQFLITLRTHQHGGKLALGGREGCLYVDSDTKTVCRQVVSVGTSCGIVIEADEVVEGLSPLAIRGVVIADRNRKATEIRVIDDGPARGFSGPVVLVDDKTAG